MRSSVARVLSTSWQSPTTLMRVARATARVKVVMGLVRLMSQASGHTASMVRAISSIGGMLRSARLSPPGPTVSPTVW